MILWSMFQWSSSKWLKDGNMNSKYFHRCVKVRVYRNGTDLDFYHICYNFFCSDIHFFIKQNKMATLFFVLSLKSRCIFLEKCLNQQGRRYEKWKETQKHIKHASSIKVDNNCTKICMNLSSTVAEKNANCDIECEQLLSFHIVLASIFVYDTKKWKVFASSSRSSGFE